MQRVAGPTVPVTRQPSFREMTVVTCLVLVGLSGFVCGIGIYAAILSRIFLWGWRIGWGLFG